MNLKLFSLRKSGLFFSTDDWIYDGQKRNYFLKLAVPKTKFTSHTKIYLYKQQGERYIFMSQGYESVIDHDIVYYAQQPFSGKVRIKD